MMMMMMMCFQKGIREIYLKENGSKLKRVLQYVAVAEREREGGGWRMEISGQKKVGSYVWYDIQAVLFLWV